jgi:hypothetical protein
VCILSARSASTESISTQKLRRDNVNFHMQSVHIIHKECMPTESLTQKSQEE